jgi:hypothetical protein
VTLRAPAANSLSKEFGKILTEGFWVSGAAGGVKTTLTPARKYLKSLALKSCPAWTRP